MSVPTDKELLLASGQGDRAAFTHLVGRHHRSIIHFVHRFLATADRAVGTEFHQAATQSGPGVAPQAGVDLADCCESGNTSAE